MTIILYEHLGDAELGAFHSDDGRAGQAERKQTVHTDEWRCENIETEICRYNGWKPETVWTGILKT